MARGLSAGVVLVLTAFGFVHPRVAAAQTSTPQFSLGGLVVMANSSEFDDTDAGFGGRFAWHPTEALGVEAELTGYPGHLGDQRPFSRSRVEGLFGVTAGPRVGILRPFAMLRTGFLTFREAPAPFACILIYPPPLTCTLASGRTVPAFDVGGGLEVFTPGQTFVRVDAADRVLKYPGPVLSSDRNVATGGFFSHDFRMTVGGGVRF